VYSGSTFCHFHIPITGHSPLQQQPPKSDVRAKNAEKLEQQLAWARGLTINDVTLMKDRDDVDTLGPMQWSPLKLKVKEAFIKANKITRAQNLRSSESLGKNVANHINAQGFKEAIKAPL
jgi:hypothetical protein